jgi:hypothetical protein
MRLQVLQTRSRMKTLRNGSVRGKQVRDVAMQYFQKKQTADPSFYYGLQLDLVSSLLSLIFEIFDLMLSGWVSFLAYPNLFGIKGFVVVAIGSGGLDHKYLLG